MTNPHDIALLEAARRYDVQHGGRRMIDDWHVTDSISLSHVSGPYTKTAAQAEAARLNLAGIEALREAREKGVREAMRVMVEWHKQMSPTAKFKRPAHVDKALQMFRTALATLTGEGDDD